MDFHHLSQYFSPHKQAWGFYCDCWDSIALLIPVLHLIGVSGLMSPFQVQTVALKFSAWHIYCSYSQTLAQISHTVRKVWRILLSLSVFD